jgi:hypothetical protein
VARGADTNPYQSMGLCITIVRLRVPLAERMLRAQLRNQPRRSCSISLKRGMKHALLANKCRTLR